MRTLAPLPAAAPPKLQTKLAVSRPGDAYEQEADRVAERILRMPDADQQRECSCGGTCSSCQGETRLQMKPAGGAPDRAVVMPDAVHDVLRAPGRPLDDDTRAFFEPRFGHDFGNVRVHSDPQAHEAARDVHAKAFTVATHVVFGDMQYAPHTDRGRELLAHELTHVVQQSGGGAMLQRAETDTQPGCAALTDSQTDVDSHVNTALTAARTAAGTPPAGLAVAQNLAGNLGRNQQTGRTAIEVWASTLPANKASLPAQSATKYAGVGYRLWSNPLFPILNPTMKINGICVGSDKLGHFFQQGWTYRQTEASSNRAAAEEESERSEGGGFGLQTTGVFSNADMEANRQGGRFYRELIAAPATTFAISRYINSRWSEVDNPNYYESSVGHQVWHNLLTGSWSGTARGGTPAVNQPATLTLAATAGGAVSGTFNVGGQSGTLAGTITYNTTSVRGTSMIGFNTTLTPISGINIEFTWTLGSATGHGVLASRGERHLVGSWGNGTSTTDRGTLDINRT